MPAIIDDMLSGHWMFPAGDVVGKESAVVVPDVGVDPDIPAMDEPALPAVGRGAMRRSGAAGRSSAVRRRRGCAGAAALDAPAIRFVPSSDSIATGTAARAVAY